MDIFTDPNAKMAALPPNNVSQDVKQSPPIDVRKPYDLAWISGKHIIVTGGATGFGEAFVRQWAGAGASLVVGDINVEQGDKAVRAIRNDTGNKNVHFVACDVTDWQQQVHLFKEAVRLSPHGGIDVVVANAGVADPEGLQMPKDLSAAEPRKPNFKVIDVNLYGLLYTTHLAIYWLPRNPGSEPASPESDPATRTRDRCLLLLGSLASLAPIPNVPLYGTSKHAVLGLFRSLRASLFADGIRIGMLCPYFIETAMSPAPLRALLAGGGVGKVEDVVDAASRIVADSTIHGRALAVGPKVKVQQQEDGEWIVVSKEAEGETTAVWDVHAHDFDDAERFTVRMVQILKGIESVKGWVGWFRDMAGAIKYGIFG
ncbi:NAD(P)-binding protein [Microthyrium microscopicum]|uniref:NAD(P)-binding protein n=1 Tax=Microthyrium microscopicum TaxID=703497 RepID=A0A6A6UTX4_9PEZI|nr:NAD(P)-binding protein [Microthyrium microscopicum]